MAHIHRLWIPLFVAGSVLLCSCKSTSVTPASKAPIARLPSNAKVFLVRPLDGVYGTRNYAGSGEEVTRAFEQALLTHSSEIIVSSSAGEQPSFIDEARKTGCAYAVIPRITRWEDRATEWSGKRDKIQIAVRVVDVHSGGTLGSATISGKSAWFTFGGDHPQDLLLKPITELTRTFFQ